MQVLALYDVSQRESTQGPLSFVSLSSSSSMHSYLDLLLSANSVAHFLLCPFLVPGVRVEQNQCSKKMGSLLLQT